MDCSEFLANNDLVAIRSIGASSGYCPIQLSVASDRLGWIDQCFWDEGLLSPFGPA